MGSLLNERSLVKDKGVMRLGSHDRSEFDDLVTHLTNSAETTSMQLG